MKICGVFIDIYFQQVATIGNEFKFIKCTAFASVLTLHVYAQQFLTVDAKKVTEKEMPTKVIAAVQRDFPDQIVLEYYLFPAHMILSEWAVTHEDSLMLAETTAYYTVLLRGKRAEYIYGLFNKGGELQVLKILFLDFTDLPGHIRTFATSGDYEGYKFSTDKYIKIISVKLKREYVQVAVEKGRDHKILILTSEGEVIKENSSHIKKY